LKIKFLLIFSLLLPLCFSLRAQAAERLDDSLLMFVGETQPVTTVASRMPEAPTTAPAMVTLIKRAQIEERGYHTLAELLADQPGFYLQAAGRGSVPYLRGLRDSILFLYDGVPMTTDVTKSFATLDDEISLAAIERVEIVRGAGSVLWGPDAFAGVVNLVPRRAGRAAQAELDLNGGSQRRRGAGFFLGQGARNYDLGLSVAASGLEPTNHQYQTLVNGEPFQQDVDDSRFYEVGATFNLGDWLHLSGRWSDFSRNYVQNDADGQFNWPGTREAPFRYLKASVQKSLGASHYRFSSFLSQTDYLLRDADIERQQSNQVLHLEMLWDRRVLSRGLFSTGVSWRRNQVDNALVRDGFLPEFIQDAEPLFVPVIDQQDFTSRLLSMFGQFRYRLGNAEYWAGLRLDHHSQYPQALSYSLGVYQPLGHKAYWKTAFGTAFRSPWSSQLFNQQQFEPERIQTLSSQLAWQPGAEDLVELTLFYSRISDHRAEDPYGGLSQPATGSGYGGELRLHRKLTRPLAVEVGVGIHGGKTVQEDYRVLAFSIIRPDGTRYDEYESWRQPADQGPRWLGRCTLLWRPAAAQLLTLGVTGGGDYTGSDTKAQYTRDYQTPWLVNFSYHRPGFSNRDRLSLRITNLFDHDYTQPDVYGPVTAPPRELMLRWSFSF